MKFNPEELYSDITEMLEIQKTPPDKLTDEELRMYSRLGSSIPILSPEELIEYTRTIRQDVIDKFKENEIELNDLRETLERRTDAYKGAIIRLERELNKNPSSTLDKSKLLMRLSQIATPNVCQNFEEILDEAIRNSNNTN